MNNIYKSCTPIFANQEHLYRESFIIEKGTYPEWNLCILLDGSFFIDDKNNIVKPGNLVFFAKRKPFYRKIINPISFLSISIRWNCVDGYDEDQLPRGKVILKDEARILSTARFLKKIDNAAESELLYNHFLKDIWYQFCIEKYTPENMLFPVSNRIVDEALKIMEQASYCNLNIDELAKRVGISHAQLINLFKKNLNVTPVEYILRMRLKKAKELLIESNWNLEKISEICGFANPFYFSNFFKKRTGFSPSVFREMHKI